MADRNNWEREQMRDRGNESNRENWGRGREDDRERESQFTGSEERNRNWEREGRYGQGGEGSRGYQSRREYGGVREPYYGGPEGVSSEGRGGWSEGRGYAGGERGYEGPRGYEGTRGYEGARGYEGSRGYDATRAYEGSRGGYEGSRGRYEGSREDYGPGAFNRPFRGGTEYFGTGQRGFGTTWGGQGGGGQGGGYGGPATYGSGYGGYGGGTGTYSEPGRHAGRGPKGYQRSDERIREDVCERLTQHPEVNAEEIEIQVKNGEVTLTGTVERREEKRMAEDAAESVPGVKDVHNQLRAQQHQGVTAGQGSKHETGSTATKTK